MKESERSLKYMMDLEEEFRDKEHRARLRTHVAAGRGGTRGDVFKDTDMGRLCSPLLVGSPPEILRHQDHIYFAIHLTLGPVLGKSASRMFINQCQPLSRRETKMSK